MDDVFLGYTESVCPDCLSRIPAAHFERDGEVYMLKRCRTHGVFKTLVWDGEPSMAGWRNDRPHSKPERCAAETKSGCPYDCGLCPEHRQQTCCVLLELTERCNLSCPVCFASAGARKEADPGLDEIESWYRILAENGGRYNIQLSGGEPTTRDDLPRIIELGRRYGFDYFQLNTNGVRLADADYAASLADAGLSCAFLQFDGTDDSVFKAVRGAELLAVKEAAIANCAALGIGVVLVPTIVPGVNEGQIGAVLRYAMARMPGVRGVHFQPVSYFGRYPGDAPEERITLPAMLRSIEDQTGGRMKASQFSPPGGEHARCSFHGSFILNPDGTLKPLSPLTKTCCSGGADAAAGMRKSRGFVARQWSAPSPRPTLSGAACGGAAGADAPAPLDSLDFFLRRAADFTFAVSGMLFQDAWNLDLERLKSCHIHVMSREGKLVPFCAYNLTSRGGRTLYRPSASGKARC